MTTLRQMETFVCTKTSGFTLVELIVILMVIGILAVVAIPRFFDSQTFESRGFHDETMALLRYAQKTAVAQRRAVCVTVNSSGVTLAIASAIPPATACGMAVLPLALPATPRNGVGLARVPAVPNFFNFLASGGTDQIADVALTVTGASGITVDRVTGYVY